MNIAKAQVTIPLGIPEVRVLQKSTGERREIIITNESTKAGTSCLKCGKWINTKVLRKNPYRTAQSGRGHFIDQNFTTLVREQQAEKLQDRQLVQGALTHNWSIGSTDEHIVRLK